MFKCKGHHCGKPNTCKCRKKLTVPMIWVLGGPGSGKGTQCSKIVANYHFEHISSGDLLRAEVASGSEKGKQLAAAMQEGGLVSNDDVLQLIEMAIFKTKNATGFLINGYPREKDQGPEFEKYVAPVDLIIFYDCADETLVTRILHRATAEKKTDGVDEQTIKNKIGLFRENIEAILELYTSRTAVINAERSAGEVYMDTAKAINQVIAKKKALQES